MCAPEGSSSTSPDPECEWPCLIRATDGNDKKATKIKLSTIVRLPSLFPLPVSRN